MKVESGRLSRGDVTLDADVVVVGTGAGGSVVLRECARAGLSVIGLEEGGHHTWRDFSQREEQMFPKLFQEGGGRLTQDRAIRVLQGRGVGGSTVHNTNLCKRTPDPILDLWAEKYSVSGARPRDLAKSFEAIERDLSVAPIPEAAVNANNDVLRRGAQALGWRSGVLMHNRVGCQQSGFCELGCAYDAKQNALKVLLPDAESRGARLYSDVRVTAITTRDGRATGVRADVRGDDGEILAHYTVRAKVVVLAASAVGSAELVIASALPDPHGQAGRRLRMHPGAVVAGLFEHDIAGHKGIPQSVECTEHLSFEEGSPQRTWIIPAFAHPIGTATTLPGFGKAHMSAMRRYRKLAVLTAMLHDETAGEVAPRSEGSSPKIHYRMIEADRAALARGLVACARLLFAAGATEVTIPAVPPVRLTSARELDALDTSFVRPHGVPLSAVHPMGTLRMGDDPRISVVSSQGEHHQVRGLFVADGSLFPTSLGGPPQISIYAFALHLSPHIVAAARR
ncbi:MAG TPA: GMC family oxidoreductase [Polyangiaceae bacterium]|nr:GMC family oxidoreductase [Polyangiaceae bacterium]